MEPVNASDYAVVIGISDYTNTDLPSLYGPADDAAMFAKWLSAPEGGHLPERNVVLLLDRDASSMSVQEALLQQSKHLKDSSARRFYIYVAGHGYGNEKGSCVFFSFDIDVRSC